MNRRRFLLQAGMVILTLLAVLSYVYGQDEGRATTKEKKMYVVTGIVDKEGQVQEFNLITSEGGSDRVMKDEVPKVSKCFESSPLVKPGYILECVGSKGKTIKKIEFSLAYFCFIDPGGITETDVAPFQFRIVIPAGVAGLLFKHQEKTLSAIWVTPEKPLVTIKSTKTIAERKIQVDWHAEDKDSPAITVNIFADGGSKDISSSVPYASFNLVKDKIKEDSLVQAICLTWVNKPFSFVLDLAKFSGSKDSQIRIEACDGFNVNSASKPIEGMTSLPPNVGIMSPEKGAIFFQGEEILFRGYGHMREGHSSIGAMGLVELNWSSNIDGGLGAGDDVRTSKLSAGEHTITLEGKDKNGLVSNTAIKIIVDADKKKILKNRLDPLIQDAKNFLSAVKQENSTLSRRKKINKAMKLHRKLSRFIYGRGFYGTFPKEEEDQIKQEVRELLKQLEQIR